MEYSAASRIFNTNELLEEILKHIPAQELLNHTRFVSKTWKTLIGTSPKLQWKTWQWKGTNIPPSVLEDADQDLFSSNGRKYGYEFAVDAVYWLRKFWCMALTFPRNLEEVVDEDGLPPHLCEWMVETLPDIELFRPWLEGIHIMLDFTSTVNSTALSVQTPSYSEIDVLSDKFTLRDFARLIYERALSSRGMGLFQHVWERQGNENNRRWTKTAVTMSELIVIVLSQAPKKLVSAAVSATFDFDFRDFEISTGHGLDVRIEYWLPGKINYEACEEHSTFPEIVDSGSSDSDDDTWFDEDIWSD